MSSTHHSTYRIWGHTIWTYLDHLSWKIISNETHFAQPCLVVAKSPAGGQVFGISGVVASRQHQTWYKTNQGLTLGLKKHLKKVSYWYYNLLYCMLKTLKKTKKHRFESGSRTSMFLQMPSGHWSVDLGVDPRTPPSRQRDLAAHSLPDSDPPERQKVLFTIQYKFLQQIQELKIILYHIISH